MSNQYLAQLSDDLQSALFRALDMRIYFRLGVEDSERIHRTVPRNNVIPSLHKLADYEARSFLGRLPIETNTHQLSSEILRW